MHGPMTNCKPSRIGLFALVLAGLYFCFASKNFAADKLRISYSAVNATQAFLWAAQEKHIFAKHASRKTYALYMKTKKTIPRDGGVDLQGARKVAESWKDFGLQKMPAPVDGIIDLSYLAEARK